MTGIGRQHHAVGAAGADEAQTALTLTQFAKPRAQVALHPPIVQAVPITSGEVAAEKLAGALLIVARCIHGRHHSMGAARCVEPRE